MKKISFLFITLIILISVNCFMPIVYAQEEQKQENNEKDKEEILILIDDYLDEINKKINTIDKKIANTKSQKEFEYYPAIRLNVDTPMFGLSSVVENKLRVKRDISTSDVAGKYSIRDIVGSKKIRLPSSYLGAIVMSTEEINIDSSMTLPQAKLTLVKCIQYLSQVNSVEDFIDTQINNIFRDYISSEKKANIKDVKNRVKKVTSDLVDISDKIKKLELLGVDVSEYKETYSTQAKKLYEINNKSKNTLILDTDLNNLMRDSLTNESDVIDLKTKISEKYQMSLEDIDYALLLENIASSYQAKVDIMESYIENSTTVTKKDENDKEEEITTVNYEVTSVATLDYMKLTLEEVNTIISDYEKELEEKKKVEDKEEVAKEKTKEQLQQEKQAKIEENSQKVDTLYNKYKEVLSREYKFYTSNINMLLKDSNDKVSMVISEIDSGIEIDNAIFGYTKYIYIELPESLEKYINENNVDSIIELENLIKLLKNKVNELSKKNMDITKLYNDILKEVLKS